MSNEFLQLSPSRIDPLIYELGLDKARPDSRNSRTSEKSRSDSKQAPPSVPPSASKFYSTSSNLTGWTPLISKTYFNEQLISFNSTPNKHILPANPNQSNPDYIDYSQGLNLTPFLTHNMNVLNNGSASLNSISNQLSNMTPFHDKTLHLADFFMDSPIRKTPIKDLDTITPSKFKMGSEKKLLKQSIFQDPKSASKRSITQVDTPPRQPHKLSISTKAERGDSHQEDVENEDDEDSDYDDIENQNVPKTKYYLQTPSKKVFGDITNLQKIPLESTPLNKEKAKVTSINHGFQTPAKHPVSSPSTVIMSSAVRSKTPEPISNNETDDENDDDDSNGGEHPPSPTPKKEPKNQVSIPVMGVFSEKKPLSKGSGAPYKPGTAFRNVPTGGAIPQPSEWNTGKPKNNKARMQAGMNKFQIVFTDVHALMNNKNKNKKQPPQQQPQQPVQTERPKAQDKKLVRSNTAPIPEQYSNASNTQTFPHPKSAPAVKVSSAPSSQEQPNVTMNTSKENSMNSMNTSHLNISSASDLSSFDLGGLSLTPNGKFFLDKVLERPSPQSQNLMNQANNYFLSQQMGSMPPPTKQQQQQHQQQLVLQQQRQSQQLQQLQMQLQHPMMMMMMMSTPQHQSVVNYGNEMAPEMSPTSDGQANYTSYNMSMTKEATTPQGYSVVNMNGQSVMMPVFKSFLSDGKHDGQQ